MTERAVVMITGHRWVFFLSFHVFFFLILTKILLYIHIGYYLQNCHVPFLFVLVTIILTFVWLQEIFITSVFWSPTSSYDLPNPLSFCFPSSILHSYFDSSFTYFCIPYSALCSFVPFLLLSFHHLSIIPCLPFPTLTTWHSIPCDSVSHFLHSLYYTIHRITPSLVG